MVRGNPATGEAVQAPGEGSCGHSGSLTDEYRLEYDDLDHLVLCDHCNHGATLHAGDGCSATRCRCAVTRETIIEGALMLAKRDIHDAYRNLTSDG